MIISFPILFHGREVLLGVLVRGYPRGEYVPAVADDAFIAAVFVLPLAVRHRRVRTPVAYAGIRRLSLTNYARYLACRVYHRRRTRQRVVFRRIRVHHLLLVLLKLLLRLLRLVVVLLLLRLLHLLLRHLHILLLGNLLL